MTTPAERKLLREVGRRIPARRLEVAISAEKLAHMVNLHPTYITSVERGELNLGLLNLVRIAAALKTNPSDFIDGMKLGRKPAENG